MRSWKAFAVAAALAVLPASVRAEVSELKIPLGAGGFGFLPLHMMQKHGLIEKFAEEAGVKLKVNWANIGGPAVMNDALLSGSAHFISAGPPAFLTLWDRTRGNIGVKSIGAISSMPMHLNARVSELKELDSISGAQKIAVTSVKVSIPSIIMQMYALKKYGKDQVFRFDPFTVTMAHPEALISLLSGSGPIVAHWASAPFDQRELKDPAIKAIMNSDDVMGGSTTFTMMSTTSRFQSENPKVFGAVVKALKRAQEMIGEDRRAAAAVLLEAMGGKGWTVDELVEILNEPGTKYTMKPENVLTYAAFMHEIGSLKNKPAGLNDLFFGNPEIAGGN
ncbi:ABC transporter substrate-binding protein [Enterovirga aerilata]|uniref:ABC transporter substrate-binding protein n=1 Tax=Enterovirga aerilata TaxID=2730920 RepID=A0A849I8U4_9HYPH|nr:ABC transporter substrate-binding protein [Enterovirga sp. DB1703]NNM72829.1 ABC transporter substrate-binding protein [Enterovirga sp. DB1703]